MFVKIQKKKNLQGGVRGSEQGSWWGREVGGEGGGGGGGVRVDVNGEVKCL